MAHALLALTLTVYAIGDVGAPTTPLPEVAASDAGEADDAPASPAVYALEALSPMQATWDRLAQCESSGNWHSRGRLYSGGLQMDAVFWSRYGGRAFASTPDLASRAQQITVAERGLRVQGWQAWPYCSRHLGLR